MDEELTWDEKHQIIEKTIKSGDYSDFLNTIEQITEILISLEDSLLFEALLYIRRVVNQLDDHSFLSDDFYQYLMMRYQDTENSQIHFLINNFLIMAEDYSDDE